MTQQVEVLAIGDELLSGETVDTNSSWIDARLEGLGWSVARHVTVPDDEEAIAEAFRAAAGRAAIVISTGGLGPTEDDLTFGGLARALGVALRRDEPTVARIQAMFASFGREMSPNNVRQAMVPASGEILNNDAGTAPGFYSRLGQSHIFVMPGVPREVRWLFQNAVEPRLPKSGHTVKRRNLRVVGLGESKLEHEIRDIVRANPEVRIGYRALGAENHVKLVAKDASIPAIERVEADIRARLGVRVFGADDQDLVTTLASALIEKRETVAVAESCTGGLIQKLLTDRAGASAYFVGGVVAYANAVKTAQLGVPAELIAEHGAVSEPVARAMAEAARSRFGATWGLSATGIAGPDGGTPAKPVGTVHIAIAGPTGTDHEQLRIPRERAMVRDGAAIILLWRLWCRVQGYEAPSRG